MFIHIHIYIILIIDLGANKIREVERKMLQKIVDCATDLKINLEGNEE